MNHTLIIGDQVGLSDWLKSRAGEKPTKAKADLEFSAGESFTRDTKRWSLREQRFNRRHDEHEEIVTDRETGHLVFWRKCPRREKEKVKLLALQFRQVNQERVKLCSCSLHKV